MAVKHHIDIENWDSICIPVYENLVKESKERFDDVISISYTITKRGLSIFTLCLVVSSFFISKYSGEKIDSAICIALGALLISSIVLMWPRKTKFKGTLYNEIKTPELSKGSEIEQQQAYYCSQLQILYSWSKSVSIANTWRIYVFQFSLCVIAILFALLLGKFS